MSDINSSLPIRTENPGDAIIKIADATTPSQQTKVDASGNLYIFQVSAGPVAPGTVAANSDLMGGQFSAALPTLTDGQQAAIQVDASGRMLVAQSDATALKATVRLQDGAGNSINSTSNALNVYIAGGGGSAADKSAFTYGTSLDTVIAGVFQDTAPTVPAGDSAAVRITSQRALHMNLRDSSGNELLGQKAMAASVPVVISSDQSSYPIKLQDGSGNAISSVTGHLNVAISDASGNAFSNSNPLPVSIVSTVPGTLVNDYKTVAALAANASDNHDYAITALKTFYGRLFWASGSGKIKAEIQISPDGSVFTTKWVGFNSTSTPNISIELDNLAVTETGTGSKIRIIITNLDKAAQDVYSTISGSEV